MGKLITFFVFCAAFIPITGMVSIANSTSLSGHRAFYEMRIGSVDKNAVVQSVSGRSAFLLEKECGGWRSAEDYMIEFGSAEGRIDRILSRFESWESKNGNQYSFNIVEQSSFQEDKDFGGYAEIGKKGIKKADVPLYNIDVIFEKIELINQS